MTKHAAAVVKENPAKKTAQIKKVAPVKKASVKKAPVATGSAKADSARKSQLRIYKRDQRDRDEAAGVKVIQPRIVPRTQAFLSRYQAEHGLRSVGAALDKIAVDMEAAEKETKRNNRSK
jgi:hypothetical protein